MLIRAKVFWNNKKFRSNFKTRFPLLSVGMNLYCPLEVVEVGKIPEAALRKSSFPISISD